MLFSLISTLVAASPVDELLDTYRNAGAAEFKASRGETLWNQDFGGRDCTSCHGKDLSKPGRHQKTGRVIEPMAPSVNSERLTDSKKIEKWFLRNCKWTMGRECTPTEKGDILLWLQQQ